MYIDWDELFIKCMMGIAMLLFLFLLIGVPIIIGCSCVNDAKIINAEYGTNYSGWDMLFSRTTIKQTLIGDKHNINLKELKDE